MGFRFPLPYALFPGNPTERFRQGPKPHTAKTLRQVFALMVFFPSPACSFRASRSISSWIGEGAGSQLWTRFALDFAALLKGRGTKTKHQVTAVGGSNERDTIELPKIQLLVGGFRATLRPARVFAKPVGDDFHYGHLGMDVLNQAREVRLDFASMSLELLP